MGNCTKLGINPFYLTVKVQDLFKTKVLQTETPLRPQIKFEFKPQLSGLRFCAVMFVAVYHFSNTLMNLRSHYDLGSLIVFFFVLSSYLLTRIMLDDKLEAKVTGKPLSRVALTFFIRRTFRIFPAYYFYLIILMQFVVEGADLRQHPAVYFVYVYNIWIYITQNWGPYVVHLWTLAVEEQFYLIWPWIILFIPNRHLPKVFICMIITGIAFRVLMLMLAPQANFFPVLVLTPACLDSFAAGALLAFFHFHGINISRRSNWIALALLPVWIFLAFTKHQRLFVGLDRTFVSFYAVVLIHAAHRGFKGFMKTFLEHSWVQHLSKISYGIYLYHLITALFFWKVYAVIHRALVMRGFDFATKTGWLESPYISFCIYFALAVLCANISWNWIEQPFNRLRNNLTKKMS